MKNKFYHLLPFLMLIACAIVPPSISYAQTAAVVTTAGTGNPSTEVQTRITNLKSKANAEISRRLTSLNTILGRINAMKHLSSTQQASFIAEVQSEISNLTALQSKIANDSDLPTLRTDVQSIIISYRIYALLIPQIYELSTADKILTIDTALGTIATKLQARIQMLQSKGTSVTNLQALFSDLQSKITDSQTQANTILSTISPLAPTGYPGNKITLTNGKTLLKTARQDVKTARQDIQMMIQALRNNISRNATPSITALPSH